MKLNIQIEIKTKDEKKIAELLKVFEEEETEVKVNRFEIIEQTYLEKRDREIIDVKSLSKEEYEELKKHIYYYNKLGPFPSKFLSQTFKTSHRQMKKLIDELVKEGKVKRVGKLIFSSVFLCNINVT